MNPTTITNLTNKILKHYPNTNLINVYVQNAIPIGLKCPSWIADIAIIKLFGDDSHSKKISTDMYVKIFNTTRTYINLGKNNTTRNISTNNTYRINIYPDPITFTTKQGKTITYYQSVSHRITDIETIQKIKNKAIRFEIELQKLLR
jgi:hypothetical protein